MHRSEACYLYTRTHLRTHWTSKPANKLNMWQEHFGRNMSIPWLLMARHLASPGHKRKWYWQTFSRFHEERFPLHAQYQCWKKLSNGDEFYAPSNKFKTIRFNIWGILRTTRLALSLNTLRPRQNGRHFPDDIFKHICLNESVRISTNISLNFVPRGPIDYKLNQWGHSFLTPICVTRPQWVNYHSQAANP